MPPLSSDRAFELAKGFHDLSVEVGNFRFREGDDLSASERRRLEDLQFDLLNASTQFNALSLAMALDDLDAALGRIGQATARMKKAIKKLESAQKVIRIATAAVTLGAAIVSTNPAAIIGALNGVVDVLAPD